MSPAFGHIGGAEPSTLTFKLATVTQTRNSSAMHQELMVISDPDSTLGNAAVLNAVPASTAWGLVTRPVGGTLSSVGGVVSIQGNSTVVVASGNSSVIITSGNSSVFQASSAWQVQVTSLPTVTIQGNSRVVVASGKSSVIVTSGNSSVIVTSGNLTSTCVQGTSPWIIAGNSTVVVASGNSSVIITSGNSSVFQASSAWQVQVTSMPTVTIQGNSTVVVSAGNSSVIITSGNSSVIVTSGNITSTCVQGTNPWTIAGNSTVVQAAASNPWITASVMQSSIAPSSGSSGVIVRQVIDNVLTVASTNAFASTILTIQSSGAALRSYVTAYSITTTNAGPTKIGFYSSAVIVWPIVLAAVSSAISGVNLAVSPPGYLFRTIGAADALSLNSKSSTIAGWQVAVSYFRAP